MKTIVPTEFQELWQRNPELPVIDVRTLAEFRALSLKSSRNIPLGTLKPEALRQSGYITADQPFYLLCRSGQRATQAAQQCSSEGFPLATVISGGILACQEVGVPLVKGESSGVISLERQVRIAAGALVVAGLILAKFVNPNFLFLSGFVGCGLIFAGISDWCGMALLLAKLPWNK